MNNFKRRWLVILLLIIFLLIYNLSVIAVSDLEQKIAKENLKRYTKKYGIAKLKPRQNNRVYGIFNELASKAHKDVSDINFELHIVDTQLLNAVYLGNGHLMLFKGLLKKIKNDEQLAAVLAHELGHGVNNDIQDTIDLIQGIRLGSLLIDLAKDGKVNQEGPDFITALSWQLLQKGFSREQERDADMYSVFLLERCDYDPQGTVGLMKVLKSGKEQGSNSKLLELFSDHPNLNNRIDYLSRIIMKLEEAENIYYSPVSSSNKLAKGLLRDDIKMIYSTYSEMVLDNRTLEDFKNNSHLKKIRKKIVQLKENHKLRYNLELRNQVEGTARVAVSFFNNKEQEPIVSLALDLIKEKYGWKVLRGPNIYQ
jgi:Zn-dependent protease with chaperone function